LMVSDNGHKGHPPEPNSDHSGSVSTTTQSSTAALDTQGLLSSVRNLPHRACQMGRRGAEHIGSVWSCDQRGSLFRLCGVLFLFISFEATWAQKEGPGGS
jgi:hypothetical protein